MVAILAVIVVIILTMLLLAVRLPPLDIPSNALTNEKLNALDEWLNRIHSRGKFNGAVLLSKKGKVIFSESYGYTGVEETTQLDSHSSFNLASVSKQFTAMGIVILNHQSKAQYEDKLSSHIPELSHYPDITILHLLHHTSGLPDYMRLALKNKSDSEAFTIPEMISLFSDHNPKLNFKPGSKFQYSNTGYVLLSEIIARVSGIPFQEFMSTEVFRPLKMNDTQIFNLLTKDNPPRRVYGFKKKFGVLGGKKVTSDLNYFDGVTGDGSIYSSIHDLNIWHEALRDGTLVPNELYNLAYLPAQLNDGTKVEYGFGWLINENNSVEHSGGWQGFTSFIYRDIENDGLIVMLDNSSNMLRVNSNGFRFNSIGINLKRFMGTI